MKQFLIIFSIFLASVAIAETLIIDDGYIVQALTGGEAGHSLPQVVLRNMRFGAVTNSGPGGVIRFDGFNSIYNSLPSVQLNGGFVNDTVAQEQSCLDIVVYRNGHWDILTLRADWQALAPATDDVWNLGLDGNRWRAGHFSQYVRAGVIESYGSPWNAARLRGRSGHILEREWDGKRIRDYVDGIWINP